MYAKMRTNRPTVAFTGVNRAGRALGTPRHGSLNLGTSKWEVRLVCDHALEISESKKNAGRICKDFVCLGMERE